MISRGIQRIGHILTAALALSTTALAAAVFVGACGDEATSGKRVTLKTRITADDGIAAPFTNAYGWSIKLSKAFVSVGPLYYFDGAPIFSTARAPRALPASRSREELARLLGLGTAHAHPGHYEPGDAMGEVLQASSADLTLGIVDLPPGDGVSGSYRSGRFTFGDPPVGSAAQALGASVVRLEGEATKDAMTRHFSAALGVSDVLDSYGEPSLEGCAFDKETDVEADGTVTIHIKPSVWLDQSEFDDIAEGTEAAPTELTPETEAWKALSRGLKKGSAVIFSYSI